MVVSCISFPPTHRVRKLFLHQVVQAPYFLEPLRITTLLWSCVSPQANRLHCSLCLRFVHKPFATSPALNRSFSTFGIHSFILHTHLHPITFFAEGLSISTQVSFLRSNTISSFIVFNHSLEFHFS